MKNKLKLGAVNVMAVLATFIVITNVHALHRNGAFDYNSQGRAFAELEDDDSSQIHNSHSWEIGARASLKKSTTLGFVHTNVVTCNCNSNFVVVVEVEISTPDPLIIEVLELGCPKNNNPSVIT